VTKKQKLALETTMAALPDGCREAFRKVAEFAVSLGYMPVLKGAKNTYADFTKSRIRRTILKIDTDPKFPPRLAAKFFAMPSYSGIFLEGIGHFVDLLLQHGHVSRCWGCGKCDGSQGYRYELPDGRKGFLCGNGLVSLPSFRAENVPEVVAALRAQDEYFVRQA